MSAKPQEIELELVMQARIVAIEESIRAVCEVCGRRAFPNDPAYHQIHGPNSAGNYTHVRNGKHELCRASSAWSLSRWEESKVARENTRQKLSQNPTGKGHDIQAPGIHARSKKDAIEVATALIEAGEPFEVLVSEGERTWTFVGRPGPDGKAAFDRIEREHTGRIPER